MQNDKYVFVETLLLSQSCYEYIFPLSKHLNVLRIRKDIDFGTHILTKIIHEINSKELRKMFPKKYERMKYKLR